MCHAKTSPSSWGGLGVSTNQAAAYPSISYREPNINAIPCKDQVEAKIKDKEERKENRKI
jgi:hypothetical protein